MLDQHFWNVGYVRMFDILKLDMPEDSFLDAYEYDVAAVIAAREQEMSQILLSKVMRTVSQ